MKDYFPDTPFWTAYQGRFYGILTWPDVDRFWAAMADSNGDWFVFDTEQTAPKTVALAAELDQTVDAAIALIDTRRDRSHCGAIYVDDHKFPTFIKVFDPSEMGSACNISGIPVLPRWIFSRIKPEDLPTPPPPEKPSLFKRLTSRA